MAETTSEQPDCAAEMPKLSADLTGPRSPDRCQSCGAAPEPLPGGFSALDVWREHDRDDRPTPVVVVLCRKCSKRIIEPHPRLYGCLGPHEPCPGAMPLCLDCVHRDGVRCASPKARMNGGPGATLVYPQPRTVHLCRRGKGARSGWETVYVGPVESCDAKEVAPCPTS